MCKHHRRKSHHTYRYFLLLAGSASFGFERTCPNPVNRSPFAVVSLSLLLVLRVLRSLPRTLQICPNLNKFTKIFESFCRRAGSVRRRRLLLQEPDHLADRDGGRRPDCRHAVPDLLPATDTRYAFGITSFLHFYSQLLLFFNFNGQECVGNSISQCKRFV